MTMTAREEFVSQLDAYGDACYRHEQSAHVRARVLAAYDSAHPAKAEEVAVEWEPKPCPFCGEQPGVNDCAGGIKAVACANDGCHAMPSVLHETVPDAIEAWNMRAAPPAPGAEKVDPKVWHDHYYQAFMRWLEDDSTHWINDKDAAWQAWMYLHEEGLTTYPEAAMSREAQ